MREFQRRISLEKKSKMDLGTFIVGMVMLAACVVPFALMAQNRKKRRDQLLFSLKKIAEGKSSSVTNYEVCGDAIIGWDESNLQLFYYQKGSHKERRIAVDLTKMIACKAEHLLNQLDDGSSRIQKLQLIFTDKIQKGVHEKLELYNADEQTDLQGEVQLLANWESKINSLLVSR